MTDARHPYDYAPHPSRLHIVRDGPEAIAARVIRRLAESRSSLVVAVLETGETVISQPNKEPARSLAASPMMVGRYVRGADEARIVEDLLEHVRLVEYHAACGSVDPHGGTTG